MAEAPGTITGGCACGAVRYTAIDRGFAPYVCHCKGCQSRQGSAFALNQQVLIADLTVEGETISGEVEGAHGARITHYGCAKCMTRLYTVNATRPMLATIRAGTRDDSLELVPAFHLWVSRKQPWIALPADAVTFDTQPATPEEWTALILPNGRPNGMSG